MQQLAGSGIVIRPATAADHSTIIALVRAAQINPFGLDWRRFLVADEQGRVIGTGQIKPHGDGSRELASIAVLPERRQQGVASAIVQALVTQEPEPGTLYLTCQHPLESFYARFGFRRIDRDEMTPYFKRLALLAGLLEPVWRVFTTGGVRLIVMKRGGEET